MPRLLHLLHAHGSECPAPPPSAPPDRSSSVDGTAPGLASRQSKKTRPTAVWGSLWRLVRVGGGAKWKRRARFDTRALRSTVTTRASEWTCRP
mmetsp:Transcript_71771/g.126401  ORF Transcript_71771/g.126401 Transcript_71771/m.126401 type:complete len:93 (+) Transcript_71771:541-819(+)